ncbi:MAG: tetratricopeptide repeat protein, partial [Lachnospiraceae bacterium]|nr:tetratricopeptide repeat protein [Lachnospiraceae bacterium]
MREGYSKEINDIFALLNEKLVAYGPLDEIIEIANKIISIGRELNDDYIIGNGYFGLELGYFTNNLDDDMIMTHVNTVPYLIAAEDYETLVRSYNNIGIISVSRNNFSNALENYLLAIDTCKAHKLKYREGLTYCNLGDMYKCIGDYRHALNYYKKAIKLCSEYSEPNPYCYSNLLLMYAGELFCYVKCGKYDEAKLSFIKIQELTPMAEDDYHLIAVIGAKFRYLMNLDKEVEAMELMDTFLEQLDKVTNLHDFFVYILDICNELYIKKHYEYIIKIAHIIESRIAFYEGCSPFLRGWIADYKIKYYKAIGNEKHYYKALRSYHQAIERRNAFIKKFNKSIVDSQIKIEALTEKYRKTEESIEKLKLNAEHDQLTGLYNYGYIKDVLEE